MQQHLVSAQLGHYLNVRKEARALPFILLLQCARHSKGNAETLCCVLACSCRSVTPSELFCCVSKCGSLMLQGAVQPEAPMGGLWVGPQNYQRYKDH
eukprot:2252502-Amphidinium_carterae.2